MVVAVLVVAGILLIGNGGSDTRDEYVSALRDGLEANPDEVDAFADPTNPLDESTIPCFAEAMVDLAGVEALEEVATPDEVREDPAVLEGMDDPFQGGQTLTRAEAEQFWDSLEPCLDVGELMYESFRDRGATEAQARCAADRLPADALRELMIISFMGELDSLADDGPLAQEFEDAIVPCQNA